MSGYIAKILGVVMAGILVDIILPNGETSKYIKGMFAIFIIFVIISPLKTLSENGINLKNFFQVPASYVNEDLLDTINTQKVSAMKSDILFELEQNGFSSVEIDIDYKTTNSQIVIQNVHVNIENLILNSSSKHINKYAFIKEVVTKHTGVNEGLILFYE